VIVGHLGLAAGVRGGWPRSSLLWLLVASIAPDLLDALMAAAGICNPNGLYSHTIPAVALLAAVVGGAAYLSATRKHAGSTAVPTAIACVVVILLHPALDFLTGQKLYWPGGELEGLRLYDWPLADFALESAVVILGWLILRRSPAVPRWAAAPATICALVVLQGAMNLGQRDLRDLKPNSCAVEAAPAR
jgi:hypothetical protein